MTTTTAKDRPILFSGPMVMAILEGRKAQTRRVMNPQPTPDRYDPDLLVWGKRGHLVGRESDGTDHSRTQAASLWMVCPYGGLCDQLWVRETWRRAEIDGRQVVQYRADGPPEHSLIPWAPSIHMPREYSRIILEIREVRAERVQDISEADAMAEGVQIPPGQEGMVRLKGGWEPVPRTSYGTEFRSLWETINGARPGASWRDNPWVWVLTFRRVQP